MHNRLSLISLWVFGDYLSQLLHGWTTRVSRCYSLTQKEKCSIKRKPNVFPHPIYAENNSQKNPWMETSENKQNKLSRQIECCPSVEKLVYKSWKIFLGKSKDVISLNNFFLIRHNDFMQISFTSQLVVWFTLKLPALQKLWFIVYFLKI